jgi:hypothetical protein
MPYTSRFTATDGLIVHLQTIVGSITDAAIKSNYAGFLSVSAVTVFELAIKDIFIEFGSKKHLVFGDFVENHFSKINGRIKLDDLKNQHIKCFGDKYCKKFEKLLDKKEKITFSTARKSIKSDYQNLILCRHKYVHEGTPTLSFEEVIDFYSYGKEVIHSLNDAMKR